MKKILYSLILFISLFLGLNNVDAYTLEDGEKELLKCYYGGKKDDPFISVIKTSKKIIVDNPSGACSKINVDIPYEEIKVTGSIQAAWYDCPAAIYVRLQDDDSTCNVNLKSTNMLGETYLVNAELGKEVTQQNEKICSFRELDLGVGGEPITFIIKKNYGEYYYRVTKAGYFESNDMRFDDQFEFDYMYNKFKIKLDEEKKKLFKQYLDANDNSCPTAEEYTSVIEHISGEKDEKFEDLLKALKNPLKAVNEDILNNYTLTLKRKKITLGSLVATDDICSFEECQNNKSYYAEKALREVATYCSNLYNKQSSELRDYRYDDCKEFNKFYDQLVKDGLLQDYAEGCGFISTDLRDKLVSVLDWIKIIGPLAAIFLGMLDFVKAIASGDPDKENKTAFKRLTTRLIAAALLFLVPLILGFLMDLFLGNDENYGKEDPFCNLVKWEE